MNDTVPILRTTTVPEPSFRHLIRMSDDVGLLEHAAGPLPKRWHGYCVDDVARGLAVVCREPAPGAELVRLAEVYTAFLMHAQDPEGAFRNRLGYDRVWHDEPTVRDWWGRGLWGFGAAAAGGATPWIREIAAERFARGAQLRSPFVHSMIFAALGAAEILAADPGHDVALELIADTAAMIGAPRPDPEWPWPLDRLTYANAALPEVLIAAGQATGDGRILDDGLALLEWLVGVESHEGHLSLTPIGGWHAGEGRPAFDQQPIEAAAIADACARAFDVTGDGRWLVGVRRAVDWFLGVNDSGILMMDARSGGGFDGLRPAGRNPNQGAESTLALISTLQHGRRWAARAGDS